MVYSGLWNILETIPQVICSYIKEEKQAYSESPGINVSSTNIQKCTPFMRRTVALSFLCSEYGKWVLLQGCISVLKIPLTLCNPVFCPYCLFVLLKELGTAPPNCCHLPAWNEVRWIWGSKDWSRTGFQYFYLAHPSRILDQTWGFSPFFKTMLILGTFCHDFEYTHVFQYILSTCVHFPWCPDSKNKSWEGIHRRFLSDWKNLAVEQEIKKKSNYF